MTLATSLPAALRTAVLADAQIVDLIGTWKGDPAVFTRRPIPSDADYPVVLIPSENASASDQDALTSQRPVLSRDLFVYGQQDKMLRAVDEAAELLFQLFHRKRFAISVTGYHVIDIVCRRPTAAPTSDNKLVGRWVPATIRLQQLSG